MDIRKDLKRFTAGEDLKKGDLVCFKLAKVYKVKEIKKVKEVKR